MKYLAVLLSMYLLALNLAPCTDVVTSDTDAKTEFSQAANDHQHQDSDLCSPFCICQCCHVSATYSQFTYIKLDINYISTQDFFYLNGTEKDITTSILQPPKV